MHITSHVIQVTINREPTFDSPVTLFGNGITPEPQWNYNETQNACYIKHIVWYDMSWMSQHQHLTWEDVTLFWKWLNPGSQNNLLTHVSAYTDLQTIQTIQTIQTCTLCRLPRLTKQSRYSRLSIYVTSHITCYKCHNKQGINFLTQYVIFKQPRLSRLSGLSRLTRLSIQFKAIIVCHITHHMSHMSRLTGSQPLTQHVITFLKWHYTRTTMEL